MPANPRLQRTWSSLTLRSTPLNGKLVRPVIVWVWSQFMVRQASCKTVAIVLSLAIGCDGSPPAAQTARETTPPAKAVPAEPETAFEAVGRAYDDPRSDVQIRKDNAFIEAVRDGNADTARRMLASGASVSAPYIDPHAFLSAGQTGYTALLYASMDGNVDMVKLLLAHKPELNYARKGKTALYFAAIKGHDELARLLKEAGAEGDPKRIRLTHELIRAACKGFEMRGLPPYPGVVRDLAGAPEIAEVVKQGVDVNWTGPEGYTPLMYAANLGLIGNVKILLAHGADASIKSKDGATALSLAEGEASVNREERKQVVELLKEHLAKKR